MSAEQNKSIVRRWIEEGWNKHNLAVIDEVYAPNFVQHEPEPQTVISREALKQYVSAYLTTFPDLQLSIEDLIAEGDKVVWRFNSTGHQTGPFMGMPPTGRTSNITGIVIFRLENSRIAEAWVNIDVLGLLQQTGVIPMPG
jgi:Predicted ester cyclase